MTPTVWSREQAEQEKREDLAQLRADERWAHMVSCLRLWIGPGVTKLQGAIAASPDWWVSHHFGVCMRVRNHLREQGFDELELGINNLDNVYVELLEEVAMT